MQKTYIPLVDLRQNVLKLKNQARKLKFGNKKKPGNNYRHQNDGKLKFAHKSAK